MTSSDELARPVAEDVDSFSESDGMIARGHEIGLEATLGRITDWDDAFDAFGHNAGNSISTPRLQ